MRSGKVFEEIELKGLIERQKHLKSAITDLKNSLKGLPFLQKELDTLEMKIASITREHDILKDFYTEVFPQVSSSQSESRVMHPAAVPSKPSQPIKIYHVGLTGFLALFVSIGMVYVFDFFYIRTFFSYIEENNYKQIYGENNKNLITQPKTTQISESLGQIATKLQAKGGSLFIIGKNGLYRVQSLDFGHAPDFITFPLRKGSVFERAVTSGNTILIGNIEKTNEIRTSSWNGYRNGSLLAFPLKDNSGEIIGVMSFHNKTTPPFTKRDMEIGAQVINYSMSMTPGNISSTEVSPLESNGRDQYKTRNEDKGSFNVRPLSSFIWYSSIVALGIGISMLASYALRKLGY